MFSVEDVFHYISAYRSLYFVCWLNVNNNNNTDTETFIYLKGYMRILKPLFSLKGIYEYWNLQLTYFSSK